ncbi:MAG: hypothetical protein WA722_00640 [Candidatus Sulfotelmatobacter sp.]
MSRTLLSLAGFQVIISGRFWVIAEDLPIITNNQAGSVIAYVTEGVMYIYVTHKNYAESVNSNTFYADAFKGYYWGTVHPRTTATSA